MIEDTIGSDGRGNSDEVVEATEVVRFKLGLDLKDVRLIFINCKSELTIYTYCQKSDLFFTLTNMQRCKLALWVRLEFPVICHDVDTGDSIFNLSESLSKFIPSFSLYISWSIDRSD